jgi:hypothetical protein
MDGPTWNGGWADLEPKLTDQNWTVVGVADFNVERPLLGAMASNPDADSPLILSLEKSIPVGVPLAEETATLTINEVNAPPAADGGAARMLTGTPKKDSEAADDSYVDGGTVNTDSISQIDAGLANDVSLINNANGGQGRNGSATGLLRRAAGGNGSPVNSSLIDLSRKDNDSKMAGGDQKVFRLSSSWVSNFLMDRGNDRDPNSGIEINLAPPENQFRNPVRRGR